MIIEYNRDPSATPEQRIQSLKENVQLAFNEQQELSNDLYKTLLKAFGVDIAKLRSDFTSFAESAQEAISQLGTEFEELVQKVEDAGLDLTDLKARMETVEDKVTALEGRMSTAEGNISNLQSRVGTLESNYVALEARVRALEGN
jgi:chromosome segregation ATPase